MNTAIQSRYSFCKAAEKKEAEIRSWKIGEEKYIVGFASNVVEKIIGSFHKKRATQKNCTRPKQNYKNIKKTRRPAGLKMDMGKYILIHYLAVT